MTTPKPTPGPWVQYTDKRLGVCIAVEGPTASTIIAQKVARWLDVGLMLAACNACQQINPENPQAVAEALPDLVKRLRDVAVWLIAPDLFEDEIRGIAQAVRSTLAKAEGRPK